MRKFKIDKDCILTESLILDLIKNNSKEKRRLSKLQK